MRATLPVRCSVVSVTVSDDGSRVLCNVTFWTGGLAGLNDNFLLLNSVGGQGPGSRLMTLNPVFWGGNYLTAGITGIRMDVRNFGQTDVFLRFLLEDPTNGPPSNVAMSAKPILLAVGSGWTIVASPVRTVPEPSTLSCSA